MLSSALLSLLLATTPIGWGHPGYDAEDSYYNPHETVLNADALTHGLRTRWTVPLRKHISCGGYGSPVVAADEVVVPDPLGISAYRQSTGRAAWHFNWDDPDDATVPTLAVTDDLVIAAGGQCQSQSDPDGRLVALDLATGKVRWQWGPDAPTYTLAVDRGMVVVSGESPSDELVTTAYIAATGKVAWELPGYDSSGVSAAGRLLLTKGKTTVAVDITSGRILWTKPAAWHAEAATPESDRFLATNGTTLAAIDAVSGRVRWTAPGKATTLVASDGRRVFRAEPNRIEALSATTGRVVWSRRLAAEDPSQPVCAGGVLYTGGPILNPATGAVLRPTTPLASPVVTGGVAYVVQDRKLISYAP